ncbi:MAG: excinuclease ABC subunit UvrC [Spirochaetia bacterium]|jgi:excinuclease ABC subunit C|nr:excinuclease ABC subunit UvrC [Spirochaetia bacterium]
MENLKANRAKLEETIKELPDNPGVYMMKNSRNEIIYIGKAKNLKSRVKSYFSSSAEKELKTSHLVKKIHSIEIITTGTEYEALILENNLIKKWKPRYNISLKDNKTFPVIRITNEDFPRIFRTRRIIEDGSLYFGPYPDVKSIDTYLELIKKRFKIRKCREIPLKKRKSPCLYYHIGQCNAPCTGAADKKEYNSEIKTITKILSGKSASLLKEFEKEMKKAADALDYENAARFRDLISSIRIITDEQKVQDFSSGKKDYIALLSSGVHSSAVVLQVRDGKLSGKSVFTFTSYSDSAEDMMRFLIQYYTDYFKETESSSLVPDRIILNIMPETDLVERFFIEKISAPFNAALPADEKEASIMKMAEENCRLELMSREKQASTAQALKELKNRLRLSRIPVRIEGFDIAHLAGKYTAASMVSFHNGKPDKTEYRIFRIKSLPESGIDDYASIREAVARRYTRLINESLPLPDLVLIDGGKGQLSAAMGVFEALGIKEINVAALAKQEELLFVPGMNEPVKLEEGSLSLGIVQHVRDEAHRFATTYNKNMRKKEVSFSLLEEIPGIGRERSKKLIIEFGSIEKIRDSDIYTISQRGGIPLKAAEAVIEYLKGI